MLLNGKRMPKMVQIDLKIEHNFCLINVIDEDYTEQLSSDAEFLKCLQFIKESEEFGLHLLLFGAYLNDNVASIKTSSDLSLDYTEKLTNVNRAIAKVPKKNMRLNPLCFVNESEQIIFRKPISIKSKKHTAVQDIGLQYEEQSIDVAGLTSIEMKDHCNAENTKNQVETTVQRTHLTVQSTTSGPNNLMINLEETDNNLYMNKKLQIQSTEYGLNNLCIHIDEKSSKDLDILPVAIPNEDKSRETMKSAKGENKPIQYQMTVPKSIKKRTNLLNHKFDEACECCHIDITNCDIDYEGNRPIKRRLSNDSLQLRSTSDMPSLSYVKTSSNPKTHKQAKSGRRKFSGVRFQQRKRK